LQRVHHNQEDQETGWFQTVSRDLSEASCFGSSSNEGGGTLKDDLDDMREQVGKDEQIEYFKGK
jgi:hypothetical protein